MAATCSIPFKKIGALRFMSIEEEREYPLRCIICHAGYRNLHIGSCCFVCYCSKCIAKRPIKTRMCTICKNHLEVYTQVK